MPGQTDRIDEPYLDASQSIPSMEGRTIARPDVRRHRIGGRPPASQLPSMEGRTIARPDTSTLAVGGPIDHAGYPSMEGRTIARPDRRHSPSLSNSVESRILQWRAGQLPGQTLGHCLLTCPRPAPSMEGRTIARPDPPAEPRLTRYAPSRSFNGGPDNCPARPDWPKHHDAKHGLSFNGGPDNCPARLMVLGARIIEVSAKAFNGGPDNCPARQSEQSDQSGRTCRTRSFNGGPDNCPARLDVRLQGTMPDNCPARYFVVMRRDDPKPSMEGRTIARPDQRQHRAGTAVGHAVPSMEGRTIARPD